MHLLEPVGAPQPEQPEQADVARLNTVVVLQPQATKDNPGRGAGHAGSTNHRGE